MAYSWQEETYPAGTSSITVDIEYLDKSYIHVYVNGTEVTEFTWSSDVLIQFDSPLEVESTILIVRRTDREILYIKFADGAAFIRENLDTQNTQFLHLAQELVEGRSIDGFYGDISFNGFRITNIGYPVNANDAASKAYVDDTVAAEALIRAANDAKLQASIDSEAAARAAADAHIQEQLTGNVPLEASAFSVISWHKQTVENSVNIPEGVNAWSFGPVITIAEGQEVTVPEGSFYTIANGQVVEETATSADFGAL